MLAVLLCLSVLACAGARGQSDELDRSFRYPPRPRPRPGYGPGYGPDPPGNFVFEGNGDSGPQRRPRGMEVLYSWRQVDFTFPSDEVRQSMIQNQQFIPRNNLILDVEVYEGQGGRTVFVTLPRVRPGVPVTLATVSSRRRRGANLLQPFPDWAAQTQDCNNGITSVFRTHLDSCGRLWVLDSGNNNAFAAGSRIACNPQVLVYDLRNGNRLIGRYRIPMSMIESNTLLVTIAVDTRQRDCSDAYAYIADSIAYKMIVFDLRSQQFWRINSILFFPYPDQSRFNVNGVEFDLSGGIFGLALGPVHRRDRRLLYFHCIDSVRQSWVETSELRNQSLWRDNMNAKPRAFNLFNGTRSSQSAAATMTDDGIMFFGLVASNEIACWNSQTRFGGRNIYRLAQDDETLQFNSGIKVYDSSRLYAATSRLQNYITNNINPNEENYRVLVGDAQEMTRGTACQVNPLSNRFDDEYSPDMESVQHGLPPLP